MVFLSLPLDIGQPLTNLAENGFAFFATITSHFIK